MIQRSHNSRELRAGMGRRELSPKHTKGPIPSSSPGQVHEATACTIELLPLIHPTPAAPAEAV
jgi:hypothetical protein